MLEVFPPTFLPWPEAHKMTQDNPRGPEEGQRGIIRDLFYVLNRNRRPMQNDEYLDSFDSCIAALFQDDPGDSRTASFHPRITSSRGVLQMVVDTSDMHCLQRQDQARFF